MQTIEKLEHGQFYHIYNHGVGERNLFRDANNYEYFLELYDKYVTPVADTYAWCLMPNHFHVLVRIKDVEECLNLTGFENLSGLKPLHQHFSNLFNAYTKALNKYHQTRGALFERPFKRKLIDTNEYLRQVVVYIHNNPVHHRFCKHPLEYPWSSYLTCTSDKATKLKRNEVIAWFGGKQEYEKEHRKKIDMNEMDKLLEL
ncbi:MAG: hypothetical protein GXX78_03645 [Bacteroidales bacterium]|nr:hypothetical protein [Bacteroidales bacterium]